MTKRVTISIDDDEVIIIKKIQKGPNKSSKEPKKSRRDSCELESDNRIPSEYCRKNWTPGEIPITLLGSVFDAEHLGKWIYDWSIVYYGLDSPFISIAGDMWMLLIQLAGNINSANVNINIVQQQNDKVLLQDFINSSKRLWKRLNEIIRICEKHMLDAIKNNNGNEVHIDAGTDGAYSFLACIFGRDYQLNEVEKLMSSIRLWCKRFDSNCKELIVA